MAVTQSKRVIKYLPDSDRVHAATKDARHAEWLKQKLNLARAGALPQRELDIFAARGAIGFQAWCADQLT